MIASAQRPSSSFSVFKPDNKPLVVRGTLGDVFETPSRKGLRVKRPKKLISDVPPAAVPPLESNLNLPTQAGLTARSRADSRMGSRFGAYSQASFFSRHNPHPSRVRHIEGLNGIPICAVHDEGYFPVPRISINQPSTREREAMIKNYISSTALGINSTSFPINTITGLQNYPFKEKAVPRIGLIPITDTWRSELRELCSKAGLIAEEPVVLPKPVSAPATPVRKTVYSDETGRIIPPPSRAMSRQSVRSVSNLMMSPYDRYAHITSYPDTETLMLEMLCQILQTDSVPAVQQWLVSAGDKEKTLVLDMIKTAMNNEEQLLQQHEQELKEPIIVPSPLPPRTATARSERRSRSRSNVSVNQGSWLELNPNRKCWTSHNNSSTPSSAGRLDSARRSTSALSSRLSVSRSLGKRTPITPDAEAQGTMRFNKGSASINKFSPLPKIEEAANPLEEKPAPLPEPQLSDPQPPIPEKVESKTEAKEGSLST